MNWWGKALGGAFGFLIGGPLGALFGAALGHGLDSGQNRARLRGSGWGRSSERVQAAFFTAAFSVMGHLAKADGRVSRDEIRTAEAVMAHMDLDAEQRRAAVELFRKGKERDFPLEDVLAQLRHECRHRIDLIRMFLEIQIQAALADGDLTAAERRVLRTICRQLGISSAELDKLIHLIGRQRAGSDAQHQRTSGTSLASAYRLLGVNPRDEPAQIKRAYRRLISQHHPDKLVSKGLPEEMIRLASQRTHEIKTAYERIREARGF